MAYNLNRTNRVGTFDLDREQLKKIENAMKGIPFRLRGRPIMKAQKEALKPALEDAKQKSRFISRSGDLASALHIVNGKFAKKNRPYVVLKAKDKKKDLGSVRMGGRSIDRGTRNWHKIIHFSILGVNPTKKMAGRRKGGSSQGRAFVFFDPDGGDGLGEIIVTKKVDHTGNLGYRLFDQALKSTEKRVEDRFRTDIIGKVDAFLKKQGFK